MPASCHPALTMAVPESLSSSQPLFSHSSHSQESTIVLIEEQPTTMCITATKQCNSWPGTEAECAARQSPLAVSMLITDTN